MAWGIAFFTLGMVNILAMVFMSWHRPEIYMHLCRISWFMREAPYFAAIVCFAMADATTAQEREGWGPIMKATIISVLMFFVRREIHLFCAANFERQVQRSRPGACPMCVYWEIGRTMDVEVPEDTSHPCRREAK